MFLNSISSGKVVPRSPTHTLALRTGPSTWLVLLYIASQAGPNLEVPKLSVHIPERHLCLSRGLVSLWWRVESPLLTRSSLIPHVLGTQDNEDCLVICSFMQSLINSHIPCPLLCVYGRQTHSYAQEARLEKRMSRSQCLNFSLGY